MSLRRIFDAIFRRRRRPKAKKLTEKVIVASGYIDAPSHECMSERIKTRKTGTR